MNIVIYARYSSHSQTEQSIEGQLQACYEFAKNNGHLVIGEYIDRAQSGTTDSRAEFQRMIADSDKHIFEGVLVYQLDRFARNRYDSAINKAKLKKNGVRVISARENAVFMLTRMGPLLFGIFSKCTPVEKPSLKSRNISTQSRSKPPKVRSSTKIVCTAF